MVRTKELRSRAWKNVVQKAYWRSVIFCVLIGIIITGIMTVIQSISSPFKISSLAQLIFSMIFIYSLRFIVKIFIINNFYLSWIRYFLHGSKTDEFSFGVIGYGFTSGRYLGFVETLFVKDLYLIGWIFLICILMMFFTFVGFRSGIFLVIVYLISMSFLLYKYYDYSFVSYILSEDENSEYKEVIDTSKRMAKFHKKNIFLLDLFFWGLFFLLGILVRGIIMKLFVSDGNVFNMIWGYVILTITGLGMMPYYLGAKAQLYLEIKSFEDSDEDTKEDIVV